MNAEDAPTPFKCRTQSGYLMGLPTEWRIVYRMSHDISALPRPEKAVQLICRVEVNEEVLEEIKAL
jgi:hypothetical protein